MSLPQTIRVRISSEGAESIGLTPVVAQDMRMEDLMYMMLGMTGKNSARIRDLLARGSLVSGGSRIRWAPFDVLESDVTRHLSQYPDSEPEMPFEPSRCTLAEIHLGAKRLPIEKKAGEKRKFLRRRSFWGELMAMAAPQYVEYSYKERADLFRWKPDAADQPRLRDAALLLPFASYSAQIRSGVVTAIDLYVTR